MGALKVNGGFCVGRFGHRGDANGGAGRRNCHLTGFSGTLRMRSLLFYMLISLLRRLGSFIKRYARLLLMGRRLIASDTNRPPIRKRRRL